MNMKLYGISILTVLLLCTCSILGNGDQWLYDSLTFISPPVISSFDYGVYTCN
jgi:hypothetical protein